MKESMKYTETSGLHTFAKYQIMKIFAIKDSFTKRL